MIHCTHLDQIKPKLKAKTQGCEEGLKTGETWVALRKCLTCGHVGCCDSSPGRHARQHFQDTGHPIIEPLNSKERWHWCYLDNDYIDLDQDLEAFDDDEAIVLEEEG